MVPLVDTVLFLLGVYWPFMAVALVVGLITGWISLDSKPGEGTK
jgi:hypothetical protein